MHCGEKTMQWSAGACAGAGGVKGGHWIGCPLSGVAGMFAVEVYAAVRRHVTRADLKRAEVVLGLDRGKKSRIGFLAEMTSPPAQRAEIAPGQKNRARG
jgi:hypothetical protein